MVFISNLSAPSLFWTVNSILVFIVCVLSAGVLILQILLISFRRNLFDMLDERKIHQDYGDMLGGIVSENRSLTFGFYSIMVLYQVGMVDDLCFSPCATPSCQPVLV